MDRIFMIADDLTGALDSGVFFASSGVDTSVSIDGTATEDNRNDALISVIPSRHMEPQMAYDSIFDVVVRAKKLGYNVILKKTDSALRGNIGAELSATLKASEEKTLFFVPAYPDMNRVTRNGIQYIDGNIPVSESVFGSDPFNPIKHSKITDVIAETTDERAFYTNIQSEYENGIAIFNAETNEEIEDIVKTVSLERNVKIFAGCAGIAKAVANRMDCHRKEKNEELPRGNIAVFCGSVNPISIKQCDMAINDGAPLFVMTKMSVDSDIAQNMARYTQSNNVTLFRTSYKENEDGKMGTGEQVADRISGVIKEFVELAPKVILFIIGGDTLIAFMRKMKISTLYPMCDIYPGVILSKYFYNGEWRYVISKSGGFGNEDLLKNIFTKLNPKK